MAKNTDLFIAQNSLMKSWINSSQLSECMKIKRQQRDIPLGQILVEKSYLTAQQLAELQNMWRNRFQGSESSIYCPHCSSDTLIEHYQPGEHECFYCRRKLASALPELDDEKTALNANIDKQQQVKRTRPSVPKEFGPYKILSELGRGGMGVVYKVKHPEFELPLALKVLLSNDEQGEEHVMRFYREIELASKLRHPNIIGIHEVGSYNGRPYYTMDYIEGQTLDKLLAKRAPLPERTALEIIEKIASGLASAHKAQIIHRDLKPANVIIDNKNRVYLMDFGIAKCKEKMFKRLTRTGTIMGTPEYMSPEQATGQIRTLSYQSDVFSLGATLYHMLTGTTPFCGESPVDTITNVVRNHPVSLRQFNALVSKKTEAVVMKALAKNIEERYPNAGVFSMDIRALLSGGKTIARPESPLKVPLLFIKRHALMLICLTVTCVAIMITLILLFKAKNL